MNATLELLPNGRYIADVPRPKTSLGQSLFFDPLSTAPKGLADMRIMLEIKAAACAATGKFNGFPVHVNRIKNLKLRALVACGMIWQNWSVKDLLECTDDLSGPAEMALLATLENPVWSDDDFRMLGAIEKMENLQNLALRGGKTL